MKIIVIDDLRDVVESSVRALRATGHEATGAQVISVPQAIGAINAAKPDAILLDIQLTEGGSEGAEVARLLKEQNYPGLIIGHSSFSQREQRRILAPHGVKHFARKGSLSILECLTGVCACEAPEIEAKKEAGDGIDVLITMHEDAAPEALKRGLEDRFSVEIAGKAERAAEKVRDFRPQVVVYETFARVTDGFSRIHHDWGHLQAKNPDLPDLADLEIKWVMLSWGHQEAKDAEERGHTFVRLPFSLAEFAEVLSKLLSR